MRRPAAILGSAIFFIAAPCVVAGALPWLLTGRYALPVSTLPGAVPLAAVPILAGTAFLLSAFARFALEGLGTPAPIAPTERLVVGGVYRFVRNPMYLAVLAIIAGQVLLFASWAVLVYGLAMAATMYLFVRLHEEPTLKRRYGTQYDTYRRNVPGWLPRLTPWQPKP
jgi:protein-S-isoprenylcysteine O-methyltransferase Ste14